MVAEGGGPEPQKGDPHDLIKKALPEAERYAARLCRRCPVLSLAEVKALAADALLAKVQTFNGTRGTSLFEYSKKNIAGRVLRAAGRRGREHARQMEATALFADTLEEMPLSDLALATGEGIHKELTELGEALGDVWRYGAAGGDGAHLTPEARLLHRELHEELTRAMSQEGADVAALVDALLVDDVTWDVAAKARGMSVSTAQRRVEKAFRRLRARLAAWDTR